VPTPDTWEVPGPSEGHWPGLPPILLERLRQSGLEAGTGMSARWKLPWAFIAWHSSTTGEGRQSASCSGRTTGDTLRRALPGLLACGWRFPRPAFCCSVPCVGPVAMREADACRGPRSLPRPSGERASSRGADLCCCWSDLAGGTCGWRPGLAVHTRVPHSGMPGCLEGISRHRCEAGGLVVPGATPTCLIASLAQLYVAVF